MEHYFISKEHSKDDFFEFSWTFNNREYLFKSCDDVFSKNEIDYGTYVLLKTILKKCKIFGDVLDIGCGNGVIGIVLSKEFENLNILATDINKTAVELSEENYVKNNVKNKYKILLSNTYENVEKTDFDFIVSNPPIKAGKKVLLDVVLNSHNHLKVGGNLIFVIKKKFGEDSIKKQLEKLFKTVEILARDSGYYILQATK